MFNNYYPIGGELTFGQPKLALFSSINKFTEFQNMVITGLLKII